MYIKQIGDDHQVDRLYIHWDITTLCQYKCSYCYARDEYIDNWMEEANWKKQQYVLKVLGKSTLPIFLGLLGGEPTLHPKYNDFLEIIRSEILVKSDDSRLYITTNLARDIDFFDGHSVGSKKEYFLISWHPEYVNTLELNNMFIEKVRVLKQKGYKIKINVLLHPDNVYWDNTYDIINKLSDIGDIIIHPHFIYSSPHNKIEYTKEFYEYFDSILEGRARKEFIFIDSNNKHDYFSDVEVFNLGINQFKGWKCWNNNYEINLDCNINQFCIERSHNINVNYFRDIKKINPIICQHEYCSCDGLLKVKKEL